MGRVCVLRVLGFVAESRSRLESHLAIRPVVFERRVLALYRSYIEKGLGFRVMLCVHVYCCCSQGWNIW